MTGTPQPAALRWIKAQTCGATYACVEVARDGDLIAVRDSKDPSPVQHYTLVEFAAFLDGAKRGEFDGLLISRQRREGVLEPA